MTSSTGAGTKLGKSLASRLADKLGISADSLKAALLTVAAAIGTNLCADAYLNFYKAYPHAKNSSPDPLWIALWALAVTALTVAATLKAIRAWLLIDVRNLADSPVVKPHGAVILGLSKAERAGIATANSDAQEVNTFVSSRSEKTPRAIVEDFMADTTSWKSHPWQAAIIALWPHINTESGLRLPPIYVLTSRNSVGKTDGSDDDYTSFKAACEKLLSNFGPPPFSMMQEAGLDFEDFDDVKKRVRDTLKTATVAAKIAPDGIIKSPIIDVTGAPRPFAIVAAALTLGNKAEGFTYVSQANKKARYYNLYARVEELKG